MKALTLLSATTLVAAINATPANAEPLSDKQGAAGAAKFTAGAVVGGLAGGPIGAVVGAIAGGLFAEQGFKADAVEADLTAARVDLNRLEQEIAMQEAKIADLEEETLARMELKVFFDTGVDQLTELDRQKLDAVADYLMENADMSVKLDGHADPRGTDEYNNVLSQERALSVKAALLDKGVNETRVQVAGHGSSMSTSDGVGAYAGDRRVDVTLEPAMEQTASQNSW